MINDFSIELIQSLVESSIEFPVNFDSLWQWCEYSTKGNAKRTLLENLEINVDYQLSLLITVAGGTPKEEINLTVDAAKQFAMMVKTDKGKEVRKYFLECERIARQKPKQLSTLEILEIATNSEKARILAEQRASKAESKNQILEAQKAQDAPLVAFAEKVAVAANEISIADMAKILGTGRNRLFDYLREKGVIQKNSTRPYQRYLDEQWFVVTEFTKDCGHKILALPTTRVTGKGQIKIAQLMGRQVKGDGLVRIGEAV